MGWFFDFAKRRIVGYILTWALVLLIIVVFYQGDPPAQAGGLFVFAVAFTCSLLYTRRMKKRQRAKREHEERMKQWQEWYAAQQAAYAQQWAQWQQMQRALQAQQVTQIRPKGP